MAEIIKTPDSLAEMGIVPQPCPIPRGISDRVREQVGMMDENETAGSRISFRGDSLDHAGLSSGSSSVDTFNPLASHQALSAFFQWS